MITNDTCKSPPPVRVESLSNINELTRVRTCSETPDVCADMRACNQESTLYLCKRGISHTDALACDSRISVCMRFLFPLILVCERTDNHLCDYEYKRITESSEHDTAFYVKAADYIHKKLSNGNVVAIMSEHTIGAAIQSVISLATYLVKYKSYSFGNALKYLEDTYDILLDLSQINGGDTPKTPPVITPFSHC